jgi:hypothetical protein
VVEHLPSNHKALTSSPNTAKNNHVKRWKVKGKHFFSKIFVFHNHRAIISDLKKHHLLTKQSKIVPFILIGGTGV